MTMKTTFKSTWQDIPDSDEIARQQRVKERLQPGMIVELRDLGTFRYSGIWDTMHCFYPEEGNCSLEEMERTEDNPRRRYLKRDMRRRLFIQLPYTLLADNVVFPDSESL